MEGGRFRSMIKRRFGRRTKKKSFKPVEAPAGAPLFHQKRPAESAHWKYSDRSTNRLPKNQPNQRIGLLKSLKRRIKRDASPNPTVYKLTQPHHLEQNVFKSRSRRRSVRVPSNQRYAVLDIPRKSPKKPEYATLKLRNPTKNHTYQRLNKPSAYKQMELGKSKQSTEYIVPANIRQYRYNKVKPIPTKRRSKKRVKFVYANNKTPVKSVKTPVKSVKTPVQSVYASQQK